ncbi:ISAs1 family transposase [Sphaerisporangium sp. NPDC051017]|uniref:ISAs1 family transposase n=1 Tax=Sphaerisporangium sp. NPDC051017 TaxID=3154636 RepID=UPI003424CD25
MCHLVGPPVAAEPVVHIPLGQACGDLLELFRNVTDGRSDQGRDHPVAAVLALAAAATVAGMKGYRAITGWIADVPAEVLADLYMRAGTAPAPAPGKTTIWRGLTDTDADTLDTAIGTWLTTTLLTCMDTTGEADGKVDGEPPPTHLRLDGKTVRGAKDGEGNQRHLLAAMIGPPDKAVVAAQAEVDGAKPRETVTVRDLLKRMDLTGTVVTADALHTVKATAEQIRARGGHFVLPVKENCGTLFDALDTLPCRTIPITHTSIESVTAGSPPTPSKSSPPRPTCRSRTSARPG